MSQRQEIIIVTNILLRYKSCCLSYDLGIKVTEVKLSTDRNKATTLNFTRTFFVLFYKKIDLF